MIVSTPKFMFHGIWLGTIFHVWLFQCDSVRFDRVDILYFFPLLSCYFWIFLSKLFVKAFNSTSNSRKMYSFKVYSYVVLSISLRDLSLIWHLGDMDSGASNTSQLQTNKKVVMQA